MRTRGRALEWTLAFLGILFFSAGPSQGERSVPRDESLACDPEPILAAAFSNRFEVDTLSTVDLVMRDASGQELRRRLRGASMVIDGRVHSLGQILWPERLRGMTVFTIEAEGRSQDAFVYLPALKRTRRITTAQRGDSFFGTDVTYEDLERRRVSDYAIDGCTPDRSAGEPVYRIAARPVVRLGYDRIVFVVAVSDGSILETLYYRRDRAEPFRRITAPRSGMLSSGGHVLPTRLVVHNHAAGRTTEVRFADLVVSPALDPRLFSVGTLDLERPLPEPAR